MLPDAGQYSSFAAVPGVVSADWVMQFWPNWYSQHCQRRRAHNLADIRVHAWNLRKTGAETVQEYYRQ
jgi:hypothetical protein